MPLDLTSNVGQLVQYGGAVAVLLFVVIGFLRDWIVTGTAYRALQHRIDECEKRYDEMRDDRDQWRDIANSSQDAAGKIARVAVDQRTTRRRRVPPS